MKRADVVAIAVVVLSMLRIASTWTLYSAAVDEPMHISAGLQLYTQHAYTLQPENPPLPRLVLAFAPWLGGMQFDVSHGADRQLLRVFYSNDRYKTNLVLARSGNLLFFALASLAVWWWARRELGGNGALIATLLFALQPMIAGHAGLATHDMATTAAITIALFAFSRWLDESTVRRAAMFGVAFGFAILCKFSCLGYVPAACLAMYIVRAIADRNPRAPWKAILPALLAMALVIACGYAFHIERFVTGIRGLAEIDRQGMFAFLFGEVRTTGWWYYFPVALALKSTIASLLLGIGALVTRRRFAIELLAAIAAILLVAMPSHLDLGVRYVLPVYAPLAIAGAIAALHFPRAIAASLLGWHIVASLIAIPDAFPYFNEAAQPRPWQLLGDSNIDWGQDVLRLRSVVREKHIDRLGIAVTGWHDWDALGFPPHYALQRGIPTQGWIAVSEHLFGVARVAPWLEGRRYERVGKSIRLYYVP